MRKSGKYAFISCYSCPYSIVLKNDKRAAIFCELSEKSVFLKEGECYASWCEIYGINHKRKEQNDDKRRQSERVD